MKLQDIITSEVRARMLIEIFSETSKSLYVREITRRVGTEINAVRRQLKRFVNAGIIKKEKRGNRLYYILRKDYPFYYELASMVAKERGVGRKIIERQNNLGKVRMALLSMAFVEGRESEKNELDLLFVGQINLDEANEIVKESGAEMKREINYTVVGEEEFEYLKGRRDQFLLSFLIAPNIILLGDADKYLNFV